MSEWVSAKEALAILGVSRSRLYQMVDEGKLTAYESPARKWWRFRQEDVEALAQYRPVNPSEKKAAA